TPHRGSPLSDHFVGLIGEPLLRSLSLLTVIALREGRLPARLAFRLGRALIGERLLPETPVHVVLETLEHEAAAEIERTQGSDPDAKVSVAEFMKEVRSEAHLIPQLMPAACDLFNAAVTDRPETFYGCVVARAPQPVLRSHLSLGIAPYEQATHLLFRWLHQRSVPMPESLDLTP
ncbi:MAG: triacylglycerol lipase, partial [Myxococcales bacterium]|nr:triacylglycerol lipase [Myxococcales bacterium]